MNIKQLSFITATLLLSTNTFAEETLAPIDVISTNKTEQSIQNTTANITVITSEDIEEKGYQTVAQAINTLAGISVTNSGDWGSKHHFLLEGWIQEKYLY